MDNEAGESSESEVVRGEVKGGEVGEEGGRGVLVVGVGACSQVGKGVVVYDVGNED